MLKALLLSFRCPHLVLPSFMVTCLKVFPSCYLLTSDSYWVFTEFCCSKEGPSHPPPIVHAYFYRVFHRVTPLCFRLLCWPLSFNEASTAVTELPGYRVFFFTESYLVAVGTRGRDYPRLLLYRVVLGFIEFFQAAAMFISRPLWPPPTARTSSIHPHIDFPDCFFFFFKTKTQWSGHESQLSLIENGVDFLLTESSGFGQTLFFFLFQRKYFQSLVNVSVLNEFLACCGSCCLIDQ